jgi:hypothetical protein
MLKTEEQIWLESIIDGQTLGLTRKIEDLEIQVKRQEAAMTFIIAELRRNKIHIPADLIKKVKISL